jgi:hypothetical protein
MMHRDKLQDCDADIALDAAAELMDTRIIQNDKVRKFERLRLALIVSTQFWQVE